MMKTRTDFLQGTLDLLVLKTLSGGAMHGYGVARRIEETTGDRLRIEEGSLYPALHRMARRGLVEADWGVSANNRRARYYRLTSKGRGHLRSETRQWMQFAEAVRLVLQTA